MTLLQGSQVPPRVARAHAMKNCLTVILAVSHLVVGELAGQGRDRLLRLRAAAHRLRDLIALDLHEEDADETMTPAPRPLSVTSLVDAVTEKIADRAENAGVELFVQCGGGQLVGSEDALHEALLNLLANAIEATPCGGGVFLATHAAPEGAQHWIVEDTGRGIPPDQFAELGQPFRSRKREGSGVGLAVARAIIDEHGGLLRVESSPGLGTVVSVWLPGGA